MLLRRRARVDLCIYHIAGIDKSTHAKLLRLDRQILVQQAELYNHLLRYD